MEYNSGSNRASNFEITSTITPWIVRHEVQLPINRNYNKIREEYDSGLNDLTGLYNQLLSYMPKKKAIQVQLRELDDAYYPITQAWRVQLYNYKRMTCATVSITAEIRPADDQSDSRILIKLWLNT